MTKQHKPVTFQPTIRPSWSGAMSYIQIEEKARILEALIKYPEDTGIDSVFWKETIKPDLDLQYEKFLSTCQARKQVARTYWNNQKLSKGMQLDTNSISNDIQEVCNTKDKDKDKDKDNINQSNINNLFSNKKENDRLGGLAKASKCQQELANDGKSNNKTKEKKYIFNGYTVKLNEKDYNSWKEEYNLLDLDYELKQIDNYLQMEENKPKQKSWFFFAKSWLNKNQKREYDKLPKGMDGKPIKNYHEW